MVGMKTNIVTPLMGIMEMQIGRSTETIKFVFETEGIENWYPFNTNYTYRYDDEEEACYLAPVDKDTYPDYGIDKNTAKDEKALAVRTISFEESPIVHPDVQESNREVMSVAEKLGVVTMEYSEYTLDEVKAGYAIIRDLMEDAKEVFEDRLNDFLSYEAIASLKPEVRSVLAFEQATEEELEDYSMFGKVKRMLDLMCMVAKAKE